MRLKATLGWLAPVSLVLGCSNATAPLPVVGDYSLTSIAGVALPAPFADNPWRMISATITLRDDGTGTWRAVVEVDPNGTTNTWSQEITYVRVGTRLELTFRCFDIRRVAGDDAPCVSGPHFVGKASPGRIVFTTSNIMRVPQVFQSPVPR